MAKYVELKEADVRQFFYKWEVAPSEGHTKELGYQYHLRDGVYVVVMTSLHLASGVGRKVGKDAIRVFAVDRKNNKGYISTRRVYRVEGWKENLKTAYADIAGQAKNRLVTQGRA